MQIKSITILPGVNKLGKVENFKRIDIQPGEKIAIVGPTGAGKSQFLYDLERLAQGDTQSKRRILVNEHSASQASRFDPKRKLIASLAQTMNFLTDLSVEDFLKLHINARADNKSNHEQLIRKVIIKANSITGEPIKPEMNLLGLSGGQSRALMVADIAYISNSPIILIDEIENAGIKKEAAIDAMVQEGKVVFIVTHDPSLALATDKRIVINNGGVVKIIKTTLKEKGIAHYLNWVENYHLQIREQVRTGQIVDKIKLFCQEIE